MPIKEQLRSADSEVQRCMALCAPAFQSAHRVDAPWVRAPMNRLCAKAFAQSLYCGSIIVPDTRFVVEAYPRANSGLFFCRRRLVHVCLIMSAMAQVACWQASRLPATTTTTAHYYSLPLTMGLFQDMPPRAGICRSAHPFPARSLVYSYSYAA